MCPAGSVMTGLKSRWVKKELRARCNKLTKMDKSIIGIEEAFVDGAKGINARQRESAANGNMVSAFYSESRIRTNQTKMAKIFETFCHENREIFDTNFDDFYQSRLKSKIT